MGCSVLLTHDRFSGLSPLLHLLDGRKLLGNCLTGRELAARFMLLAGCDLELARGHSLLEMAPYLAVRQVAHATPEGIAHDIPLIGDGFTLEVAALGESHRFLSPFRCRCEGLPFHAVCPISCLLDDSIRLIAELRGDLPVSGQYLGRGMNFLLVAGGVGGNLRRLWPRKAALFEVLPNLLAAGAGGVKIFLRVRSTPRYVRGLCRAL